MILLGWVLWHINRYGLFKAKPSLYLYIKYIGLVLVSFYDIINHCWLFNARSRLYIHIKYVGFGLVWFYGISTITGYLMPNPIYTYTLNIYDLVWFGLVLWHINHCRLFNAKSFLYMYIKYIWFGLVLWYINHWGLLNAKSSIPIN